MQYPQTRYQDSLAIGINDTQLTLQCDLTPPTRTQGILTIGRLQSNTEDVYYTSVSGNTVNIALRGLSQTALTPTSILGNQLNHLANESLEMTTHHNYDTDLLRKSEDDTVVGTITFTGADNEFTQSLLVPSLSDVNGNLTILTPGAVTPVNYLEVDNSATGVNVILKSNGTDTNVNLEFQGKGTGTIIVPDGAQNKTSAAPLTDPQLANKKYVDDQIDLLGVNSVDIQEGRFTYALLSGGTTAYTATLTPTLVGYTVGQRFYVKFNVTNGGASTLNIDGNGPLALTKSTTLALNAGDCPAGSEAELMYDGTRLCILAITSPYSFLTTKGDLFAASAAEAPIRVPVGTNSWALVADSTQASGLAYKDVLRNVVNADEQAIGWYTNQLRFTGSATDYNNGIYLFNGGTNNLIETLIGYGQSGLFNFLEFSNSKDVKLKTTLALRKTGGTNNAVAFGFAPDATNIESRTAVEETIKFWSDGVDIYSVTADGTTNTNKLLAGTSVGFANPQQWEIVWNPGVDVKFYINGVLKSTHTAVENVPTSNNLADVFAVANSTGGVTELFMLQPTLSQEL